MRDDCIDDGHDIDCVYPSCVMWSYGTGVWSVSVAVEASVWVHPQFELCL